MKINEDLDLNKDWIARVGCVLPNNEMAVANMKIFTKQRGYTNPHFFISKENPTNIHL